MKRRTFWAEARDGLVLEESATAVDADRCALRDVNVPSLATSALYFAMASAFSRSHLSRRIGECFRKVITFNRPRCHTHSKDTFTA